MDIVRFDVGDKLIMKKKHPCGGREMEVLYRGSDVKIRCCVCGHTVTVPREKLEKNIAGVVAEK